MENEVQQYREHLYSIHIIDQGVSVFSESITPMFDISDALLFGFLSALYSYTFAMGEEIVKSVDFGKCKLLFEELHDGKLLIVIVKSDISSKQEEELLSTLKIRYEILSQETTISEIASLLEKPKTLIPIELIAEIRRRRKDTKAKEEHLDKVKEIPSIAAEVPQIQTERFGLEFILNEELINPEMIPKIRNTLGNFFLAYKKITCALFTIEQQNELIIFAFYRGNIEDIYTTILSILQQERFSTLKGKKVRTEKLDEDKDMWVAIYRDVEAKTIVHLISPVKSEIEMIKPHIQRITRFVKKITTPKT